MFLFPRLQMFKNRMTQHVSFIIRSILALDLIRKVAGGVTSMGGGWSTVSQILAEVGTS